MNAIDNNMTSIDPTTHAGNFENFKNKVAGVLTGHCAQWRGGVWGDQTNTRLYCNTFRVSLFVLFPFILFLSLHYFILVLFVPPLPFLFLMSIRYDIGDNGQVEIQKGIIEGAQTIADLPVLELEELKASIDKQVRQRVRERRARREAGRIGWEG